MKLFRRVRSGAEPPAEPNLSLEQLLPQKPREISLSPEQKIQLEQPIDPRVDRILQEIYTDRAAAERALQSRRIIDFPTDSSSAPHVVQDKNGFWRIVAEPVPEKKSVNALDAL